MEIRLVDSPVDSLVDSSLDKAVDSSLDKAAVSDFISNFRRYSARLIRVNNKKLQRLRDCELIKMYTNCYAKQ